MSKACRCCGRPWSRLMRKRFQIAVAVALVGDRGELLGIRLPAVGGEAATQGDSETRESRLDTDGAGAIVGS